jgi:hypothetical protein
MRKLHGRFTEIDLADPSAKEKMRSAPVLDAALFDDIWKRAPENAEEELRREDEEDDQVT